MFWNVLNSLKSMEFERLNWLSFYFNIPANTNGAKTVDVSSDGSFKAWYLGGQYTTLTAEDTDSGACDVSIKLTDNGRRWEIFDNLIPMSLFCNPGRQRASGVAGDPSNPLYEPIFFPHHFLPNSKIKVEYANDSAYANKVWLIWYGMRIFEEEGFNAQEPYRSPADMPQS